MRAWVDHGRKTGHISGNLHWKVITVLAILRYYSRGFRAGKERIRLPRDAASRSGSHIKLGKIKILHIINVHDSGKLINPKLAEMQVQGGMSMGIGYGLSEQLILDEKTGRPLNGTLLDYKLMTMMDTPDIRRILWNLMIRLDLSETKHWVNRRQFRVHRQSVMQYFMQQV